MSLVHLVPIRPRRLWQSIQQRSWDRAQQDHGRDIALDVCLLAGRVRVKVDRLLKGWGVECGGDEPSSIPRAVPRKPKLISATHNLQLRTAEGKSTLVSQKMLTGFLTPPAMFVGCLESWVGWSNS